VQFPAAGAGVHAGEAVVAVEVGVGAIAAVLDSSTSQVVFVCAVFSHCHTPAGERLDFSE
jgi:O-acetyl-ADP-ribose deacetylase (regulator of RNase III)